MNISMHIQGLFSSVAGCRHLNALDRYLGAFQAGGDEGDGNSCAFNDMTGEGGYPCARGFAGYTPFFMGGIHPRAKRVVGQRLAAAARNLVYGDTARPYTGPVLAGCRLLPDPCPSCEPDAKHSLPVIGPRLELTFGAKYFADDSTYSPATESAPLPAVGSEAMGNVVADSAAKSVCH